MTETASVLIVDDSRLFRAAMESALASQTGLRVAGSVFSGEHALEFVRTHAPDIVTLDVEMPGMNGLQTLQAIQQINRTRPAGGEAGVIMVSAFTKRGTDVTIQALQAGAFDFVAKPTANSVEQSVRMLQDDLIPKIRMFLARRNRQLVPSRPNSAHASPSSARVVGPHGSAPRSVRAILVAASTGGPKALAALLPSLVAISDVPVLVVQHMPVDFTRSLAEHLTRQIGSKVVEAEDGLLLQPRVVYIARGGMHLVIRRDAQGRLSTGLNSQAPESGCRPSANVLFRSAAAVLGGEAIAIQLTGMGNDGTAGLGALKRAGAYVIAQDEESSVVWGMPGSAVAANVVDSVVPLNNIATVVEPILRRRSVK